MSNPGIDTGGQNKHGILYVVATPIGNLSDFSSRGQEVLANVDLIAAEDTRHTRVLLQHFGISTPLLSYHDHVEIDRTPALIDRLLQGESIALVSDAGTPLVSDPGYHLIRAAQDAGIRVVPVPGPCAAVTALSCAGLPTNQFCFEGFLPEKSGARQTALRKLQAETRTMVFYESPHRIRATLEDMVAVFGDQREASISRELTKRFEAVTRAPLCQLVEEVTTGLIPERGEIVLVVAGVGEQQIREQDEKQALELLRQLLPQLSLKQAVKLTASISGVRANWLYDQALILKAEKEAP